MSRVRRPREGKRKKEGDKRAQDGLSRDRLTEVMRREDERGDRDSGIKIRSRLTLLDCVSLSKCPYSIFTEHTHTHTQGKCFLLCLNLSLQPSLFFTFRTEFSSSLP